jgi:hypothetical protein
MTAKEALPMLRKQAYLPLEMEKEPAFSAMVEELSRRVNLWHMTCTKDPQAAHVAYEAMSAAEK